MPVTVTIQPDYSVEIPDDHPVLKTSVPLSMVVEEGSTTYTVNSNLMVSGKDFQLYLSTHRDLACIETGMVDFDACWKDLVSDAVSAMRVAVKLNDETTVNQCMEILYRVCYGLCDDSPWFEIAAGFCFHLLLCIMRTCEDSASVIVDVLSHMPIVFICGLMANRSNPIYRHFCWHVTEFTPVFMSGVLLGLDMPSILFSAIRNEHISGKLSPQDSVIVKYHNTQDEISFEDACSFTRLITEGSVLIPNLVPLSGDRIKFVNDMLHLCPTTRSKSSGLLHNCVEVNNSSIARLMFTQTTVQALVRVYDMNGGMQTLVEMTLNTLFPTISSRLGELLKYNTRQGLRDNTHHHHVRQWQDAILSENYRYFADNDRKDIADACYAPLPQ